MWRMGISPCSNLVTATSPGQAPLPSPPSKCKLTADKAYGASPALRASVFIISWWLMATNKRIGLLYSGRAWLYNGH